MAPVACLALAFAMLVPASPHIMRGLVLCIGEGHIDIEAAGSAHHEESSGTHATAPTAMSALLAGAGRALPISHDAKVSGEEDGPCRDIPLRLTRAADPCYQAVQNKAADMEMPLLNLLATTALGVAPRTEASHFLPRSAPPAQSSEHPPSTVVLLI